MNNKKQTRIGLSPGANSLVTITLLALSFGCHKPNTGNNNNDLKDFRQVNLVANTYEYHPVTVDSTFINGFGIAWVPSSAPNGIAWVNSVGGHVSEIYSGEGAILRDPVNIPSPTDSIGGFPCGIVFSGGQGFNLPNGPSLFLFSGFDGVISGWNPASGLNAQRLRNPPHSSYTGLAIAASGGRNLIYGANFGAKRIDVWDTAFSRITTLPFDDHGLPPGYSPYNIQAVGNKLFVMYAELDTTGHGIPGPGKGYVNVFNNDGSFVKRFAAQGSLNIPWGVTIAPGSFLEAEDMSGGDGGGYGAKSYGSSNHDPKDSVILVGNFGDGRINVYSLEAKYLGQLQSHSHPIVIDGLWALSFAPATASALDPKRLYFTAGPDHESDGLFGYLVKE